MLEVSKTEALGFWGREEVLRILNPKPQTLNPKPGSSTKSYRELRGVRRGILPYVGFKS